MTGKLQIRSLSVGLKTDRGQLHAVRGIDLDLPAGQILALVGESGSGKTVTAKAVMGLLPGNGRILSGEILLDGQNLLALSDRQMNAVRGSRMAMVLQDPMSALDPIVTVGGQMTEAIRIKKRLTPAQAKARALELLEEVGIDDPRRRFSQYPFQCSGGICQRIVIAMALACDPELLICDEPTTAMDVTIQAQILELLHRLQHKRQLTVLFISHDMGVVANIADSVAVMYAGKIVEQGTTEDIFYRPAHPYTWALLSSVPDPQSHTPLQAIPGTPPDLTAPPAGDAFAPRNPYAMQIDYEQAPPMFSISPTHSAATWLLHPDAPKVPIPPELQARIDGMRLRKEAAYV